RLDLRPHGAARARDPGRGADREWPALPARQLRARRPPGNHRRHTCRELFAARALLGRAGRADALPRRAATARPGASFAPLRRIAVPSKPGFWLRNRVFIPLETRVPKQKPGFENCFYGSAEVL